MRKLFISIFLLLPLFLSAQRATINGYVSDAESGERLIGASVYDALSSLGTVTNNAGYYTLTLSGDTCALQVSYVGYQPSTVYAMRLQGDTLLNIRLKPTSALLDEVEVVAHQSISGPKSTQMSAIEVPVAQIKGIPALAGEVDVLKAIQLLPGVQSGSEGATGIYVRGGGPDENLILLDGVPLYSVSHAMGMFSVFNADAVKNVTLYKGNFPARYGSRLSSIIDVRQNDGNSDMWHGNLTIGLIAAKLNVGGPIFTAKQLQARKQGDTIRAKTTFNISVRRSYYDALISPIMAAVSASQGEGTAFGGYYFYDLNAKVSHTFSENDRLSASFYMGDDVIYVNYNYKDKYTYQGATESEQYKTNLRTTSGNIVAAANYEHRFNSRLFSNSQISFTRYLNHLKQSLQEKQDYADESYSFDQSMLYSSFLMDLSAKTDFEFLPSPKHTLRFGAEYTYHQFRPAINNFFIAEIGEDERGNPTSMKQDTTYTEGTLHGHDAVLYVEENYTPTSWLSLNAGLRGSLYSVNSKTYPSIEPRVGVRVLLYKDLAFKASYSYMSQYVHLLSNSSISLPTDLWVPVTKNIAPMRSMQAAGGLSYNICNQVELSVEGYYKQFKNLIEYKDGASFFGTSQGWEDKVAIGDGWSYGVELLLQRKFGALTGWIGYTWNRSMRRFDREGMQINFGKPFRAKYDREHDLSITLKYQITKKIDICATFVYGTGNRATLAEQVYSDPEQGKEIDYISERNNYQMPNYHRLDLGANFYLPHKKSGDPTKSKGGWLRTAQHILSVNIYNAYCHKNPYLMFVSGNQLNQVSIFPIIPTLNYTFKF